MSSNLTEDELENIVKSRLLKEYFKRENLMFSNRSSNKDIKKQQKIDKIEKNYKRPEKSSKSVGVYRL